MTGKRAIMILGIIVVAAGLAFARTGPAHSRADPPGLAAGHCATTSRAACSECTPGLYVDWYANAAQWAWEVKQADQTYVPCSVQGALLCRNRLGATHWRYGGWVRSIGVWSGVNCDSSYPYAVQGNLNYSDGNDADYCYKKLYTF